MTGEPRQTKVVSMVNRRICRALAPVGVLILLTLLATPAGAAVNGQIVSGTVTCNGGVCSGPGNALGTTGTFKVTATGFTPERSIWAIECEHGATDSDQCDSATSDNPVDSDASGNYSNPAYTYFSMPNEAFGGISSITCDESHLCDLVLIQDSYNDFANPHVNIPLVFNYTVLPSSTPEALVPLGLASLAGLWFIARSGRRRHVSKDSGESIRHHLWRG